MEILNAIIIFAFGLVLVYLCERIDRIEAYLEEILEDEYEELEEEKEAKGSRPYCGAFDLKNGKQINLYRRDE